MGLGRSLAVALTGIVGELVEVEVDISAGIPGLAFTGLGDASVVESRDRVRAALINSRLEWPNRKVTVGLLPADVRKVGSRFDLAIAVGLLAAGGQVKPDEVASAVWMAELGLDGRLRPVNGVLPAVLAATRAGVRRIVVARGNAAEAALVPGADVRVAGDLREVVDWLRGEGPALARAGEAVTSSTAAAVEKADLADVAGQSGAKRAIEIAAAGGHHVFLLGAPGAGKSMLAARLPSLLPALDDEAALEVSAVHSVIGLLARGGGLIRRPPWQAPHHTATVAALVGGGSRLARPGSISLACHGVLFLDEAPHFSLAALDALREPLEQGEIVLHRQGGSVRYPARFQLVLAANPCPCGSPAHDCICAPQTRRRYLQRLSGPLLDRVDLRVPVESVTHAELMADPGRGVRETSAVVAARVAEARELAAERYTGTPWRSNADVAGSALRHGRWAVPRSALAPAELALQRGRLSARGYDRVLRLAWTVSDLGGHVAPDVGDVSEALFFRIGHSETWAA